jgi:hypothetical protein
MNEYQEKDFGNARFPQNKKGFETFIDCFGTIESMDKKYVLFKDNDGYQYLIDRKDFKFEKREFKK